MSPPDNPEPPDFEVRYSERFERVRYRKNMRVFAAGGWLSLLLAAALGQQAFEGLKRGEWVALGWDGNIEAPWWLAATLGLAALGFSLWCFRHYLRLRADAPALEPGDEVDDDD